MQSSAIASIVAGVCLVGTSACNHESPATSTLASAPHASATPAEPHVAQLNTRQVVLPGGPGLVRMDFIGYDPSAHVVWIPAGNTGRVDLLDTSTGTVQALEGFPVAEIVSRRGPRVSGPSSVALDVDVAFVGNRANNSVCVVDKRTHTVGACATLASMPDDLALVASAHELWVTTPRDHSITVLHVDGSAAPQNVATIHFDGSPECYALDAGRRVFYTNLEDLDRTVAVDLASRQITSTWEPHCGGDGPHGLAIDTARQLLFVACDARIVTLDLAHGGAVIATTPTGTGIDDISYDATRGLLYVASSDSALLEVLALGGEGPLRIVARATTSESARNAISDELGRIYVTDPNGGRIFIVEAVTGASR